MTHYQTLQVDNHASDIVIKAAHRALSMKFHPDKNPGNKQCEIKMQQINNAYSVLSDANKRAAYDQTLAYKPQQAYTHAKPAPAASKPKPDPAHEPAPKPDYNKPGREWGYGFEKQQSWRKPQKNHGAGSRSISLKNRSFAILKGFSKGITGFFEVLHNVFKVILWPIIKWTFIIFLVICFGAILGCFAGSGDDHRCRCRYNRY